MSRRLIPIVLIVAVGGCSLMRQSGGAPGPSYRPVAASTVLPAPATGNLLSCGTADPNTDKPSDKSPADTVKVKSRAIRQVAAALCSVGPSVVGVKPVKTPLQ